MKKLFIISAIVAIVGLTSNQSNAQVSVHVSIGAQPRWVPAGYQSVNYYYLPEVQSYYYVPQRQFVYLSGNRWIRSSYLPSRYRGYNLNNSRKIVVHGNNPYRNYSNDRVRYANRVNVVNRHYGGRVESRHIAPRGNYRNERVVHRPYNQHRNQTHIDRGHNNRGNTRGRH